MNRLYLLCARRILGAPAKTSNDAVLVRLGWMPLYHLLIFRALVWYVKGLRGLAGPALQELSCCQPRAVSLLALQDQARGF